MDTLKNIRQGEHVKEITQVIDSSNTAYVTVELQRRGDNILVFMCHSDDVVDVVLRSIDADDSGYIFFNSELEIDPLSNCMVPKHRAITDSEIEGLIKKRAPLNKLPILRMLDPIRRWHNFPRGSIVAIDRHNGHVYFRRVV